MDEVTKEMISRLRGLMFVLGAVLAMPTAVHAQTEAETEAEEEEDPETSSASESDDETPEKIVVTGSRVARSNVNTPVPVTIIGRDQVANSGVIFWSDYLSQIPQLAPSNAQTATGGNNVGANVLNLRGFGSGRTLTLVNGRRHVGGFGLSPVVDINQIPQDLIVRTELLTGGASAAYGADAMVGVSNIILRDRFDGVLTRGQFSITERGDVETWFASALLGSDFAGDRGNALIALEYQRRGILNSDTRDFTRTAYRNIPNPEDMDTAEIDDGIPDTILTEGAGVSFISGNGVVFARNPDFQSTFNPDGSIRPWDFGSTDPTFAATFGSQVGGDVAVLQGLRDLLPLQDRINATSILSFKLSDWAEFYAEAKFVFTENSANGSGQPSFDNVGEQPLLINRDNAFLPTGLGALMDRLGIDTVQMRRFNFDVGRRTSNVTRLLMRGVAGFRGDVNDNISYDVGVTWGRAQNTNTLGGNRLDERFFAAADAVVDTNGDVNGIPGEIVCRVSLQRALGQELTIPTGLTVSNYVADNCVPTSLFGAGAVGREANEFLVLPTASQDVLEQVQVMGFATLSSDNYFELPGGPISLVLGSEYRRDQARSGIDAAINLNITNLAQVAPGTGTIDVGELFAELNLPVVAGLPGIQELTLNAGGRASRYSLDQASSVFTATTSALYRPTDDVALRGSVARAIRAPSIGEAFDGRQPNFVGIADPCDDENINDAGPQRVENCIALAERVGFQGFEPEVTNIPDEVTRLTFTGGNSELDVEKSRNWGAGVVLTPRWVPNLSVTGDYYYFRITDAIGVQPVNEVVDDCVDFATIEGNEFCDRVTRSPTTFEILEVDAPATNLVALETDGIDLELEYFFDVEEAAELLDLPDFGELGTFNVRVTANHLLRFRQFPDQNDAERERVFEGFGGPQWRVFSNSAYTIGRFSVGHTMTWIDGYSRRGERQDVIEDPDATSPSGVRPKTYHNINLSYQALDYLTVNAGSRNLFDSRPPIPFSGASGLYDIQGRTYYLGAQISY